MSEQKALAEVMNEADAEYSQREYDANLGRHEREPGDWYEFIASKVLAHLASEQVVEAVAAAIHAASGDLLGHTLADMPERCAARYREQARAALAAQREALGGEGA